MNACFVVSPRLPGAVRIAWLVPACILLILTCGCRPASTSPPPSAAASPVVTVAHPLARRLADWDEFTGRLAAPESVEIRARVSGYLDRVHFREGAEVQPGDLLFTIDPRPYRAGLDRASAELARARHRAQLTAIEATRAKGLFASRAISADNHDERLQAAAEAAEAVRSAEASLASAQLELEFTEIRSPVRGRVSNARVTVGNLVQGGTVASAVLTTVVSLDPVWCYLEIDERSALRYRRMDPARGTSEAPAPAVPVEMGLLGETGFPRSGRLDFVDNQLNSANGTLRVRAVFPNPDHLATPGAFARVRVPGSGEYDAVLVRDVAIGSDQGRPFVWVVGADDTAAFRPITTGPLVDGLRAVRTGLEPGDRVVINGLQSLRPGVRVSPQLTGMNATNAPAAPSGRP